MPDPTPHPTNWAAGRYEAVAERIALIAGKVVDAVDRRGPVSNTAVVDLACGTGSAALAAAAAGAQVTAVDLTRELIAIATARPGADSVNWVVADAAHTGLPGGAFDAAVSNMGIIFVEPDALVAEVGRLLRPGGIFGFSAWIPEQDSPFRTPIVATLGRPAVTGQSPEQWGDPDIVRSRLASAFDDITIETGAQTWQFDSLATVLRFLQDESPMHVDLLGRLEQPVRQRLMTAFEAALREHTDDTGLVSFDSPYLIATARRR
ncbi:class I SAM-dependent methyltransferase [Mycobacterium sp. 21AC1]|uniref:class I SAM-dependent methyltransferase n=1 Tax=[Mycobacterium] appelbergii TaxID=2939269 RepID=UPI002938D1AB|nr:class I SAM-dependent methyltransferase [Mycobacterium sp. 21AC1]MDV3126826.1 class I SAM-dependent methyltransferase [Mycobacterium sp. 21AC1]